MRTCPCGKKGRAIWYCHKPGCGAHTVAALPKPDVSVSVNQPTSGNNATVTVDISREGTGKPRSYHGEATSVQGAVKDVVEKILGEPGTAEYIKRPGE